MRMKEKDAGWILLLAFLAVAAAGCGRSGEQEAAPGPEESKPAAQQPAPAQPKPVEQPRPTVVKDTQESAYGFYTIQVSSWRTQGKARAEAARLTSAGLEAYVQRADLGAKGVWYRVRVGRYPALSEAQQAAEALSTGKTWVDNYKRPDRPPH